MGKKAKKKESSPDKVVQKIIQDKGACFVVDMLRKYAEDKCGDAEVAECDARNERERWEKTLEYLDEMDDAVSDC